MDIVFAGKPPVTAKNPEFSLLDSQTNKREQLPRRFAVGENSVVKPKHFRQ
jgi:hypothetical protein